MLSIFASAPSFNFGFASAKAPRSAVRMEAKTVTPLPTSVKPGVVTGQALGEQLRHPHKTAKREG